MAGGAGLALTGRAHRAAARPASGDPRPIPHRRVDGSERYEPDSVAVAVHNHREPGAEVRPWVLGAHLSTRGLEELTEMLGGERHHAVRQAQLTAIVLRPPTDGEPARSCGELVHAYPSFEACCLAAGPTTGCIGIAFSGTPPLTWSRPAKRLASAAAPARSPRVMGAECS